MSGLFHPEIVFVLTELTQHYADKLLESSVSTKTISG